MSVVGFEADITNIKSFKKIEKIIPKTRKSIRASWFALGRDLTLLANVEIKRRPKGGKTYLIRTQSGRIKRHVASAPGETHANLSGKLRRSISWKIHGYERMEFGYGFSTTASNRAPKYDEFVEDGTKKMSARPSIANTVNTLKRTTKDHFQRAMLKEFRRV